MRPVSDKWDKEHLEDNFLSSFQRLKLLLRTFFKSVSVSFRLYLQSKVHHLPATLPKRREESVNAVLEQGGVQTFLHSFAQECGIPVEQVERNFRQYLHQISADMNYLTIPFWDFMLTWAFELMYEGFELDRASLEKIRPLIGKVPVVFVPNHRSHTDYLIFRYLLHHQSLPLPFVCAGSNLSFWPLGPMFRMTGAFFIRRSYEGNKLYAAAVQAYMEQLIRDRLSLMFFIEGTRSRTGKLLPPRMGILSAVVKSWQNGAAPDIIMVPTSITYESILEEKSYMEEHTGAMKKSETIWDLFRLRQYLRKKKGKVYIEFGEPLSMKEAFEGQGEDQKQKTQELAYDITYGINKATVVTTGSLVATALLTHPRRSISKKELLAKISKYVEYLNFKKALFSEAFEHHPERAIMESVRNYRRNKLLMQYLDDDEIIYRVPEERRLLLDYYKNTSLHFFVSMGVLSVLLQKAPEDTLSLTRLAEDYGFLQNLFQHDFTFSRRQPLAVHLEKLVDHLKQKKWVEVNGDSLHLLSALKKELPFFALPLRNFFEGYFIVWKFISRMGDRPWESRELLKALKDYGDILYIRESIYCPESSTRFIFDNALSAFCDLGLLSKEQEGVGKKKRVFYKAISASSPLHTQLAHWLTPVSQ